LGRVAKRKQAMRESPQAARSRRSCQVASATETSSTEDNYV